MENWSVHSMIGVNGNCGHHRDISQKRNVYVHQFMQEKVALLFLGLTNPQDHHTENSPPSKRTLVYETNRYLRCEPLHKNTQREILRRRPKNNNKARIKLSEAILSTLRDCWEKAICSSLPARLMEEFPASKVHLQPTIWLTGKFISTRMSRHYWPVWVWS